MPLIAVGLFLTSSEEPKARYILHAVYTAFAEIILQRFGDQIVCKLMVG